MNRRSFLTALGLAPAVVAVPTLANGSDPMDTGTITVNQLGEQLSAISANIGTVTAGRLIGNDFVLDFGAGTLTPLP
jgi:hypothetical protein